MFKKKQEDISTMWIPHRCKCISHIELQGKTGGFHYFSNFYFLMENDE